MPRHRSPLRDKARELWIESGCQIALKEIAGQLGVADSQIRKWKLQDKWEEPPKGNVPNRNRKVTKRPKGGAPVGNKNAKGNIGGGPYGNKHAVTTGEHESIWFDALTDEERDLSTQIITDELRQVEQSIILMEIRERRMLHRIKELQLQGDMIVVSEMMTEQSSDQYGVSDGRTTTRELTLEKIQNIEEALTRIQEKKLKAIELKHKLLSDIADGGEEGNLDELTAMLEKSVKKYWGD